MKVLESQNGVNRTHVSKFSSIFVIESVYSSVTSKSHIERVLKEKTNIGNDENISTHTVTTNKPTCCSSFSFDESLYIKWKIFEE